VSTHGELRLESEVITARRADGLVIRSMIESFPGAPLDTPIVLVVPPYSKSMRDLVTMSLCMVLNGFRTWRFDHTNHVGASDGEIIDFSLSSAAADVVTIFEEVVRRYPGAPLGVLTSSLGSRVAFRTFQRQQAIRSLVSLVGVVNVQHALHQAIGRDLVGQVLHGEHIPATAVALGYEVRTHFIHDAIECGWHTLESTSADLALCPFPIVQILGELDTWTPKQDVARVFAGTAPDFRTTFVLPGASHKLEHNPSAAREALLHAGCVMNQHLRRSPENRAAVQIRYPSFHHIVTKNRHERRLEKERYPEGCVTLLSLSDPPIRAMTTTAG
jgi:pimeloyl-ACP methyl ester carboxylesterase